MAPLLPSIPHRKTQQGNHTTPVMAFKAGIKAHREQPLSNWWETAGLEAPAPQEHPN